MLKRSKKIVYELLKGYESISKTEEHYRLLKKSIIYSESSL